MLAELMSRYISEGKLFSPRDMLLVAVSGGIDSVVLCHLLKLLGYEFEILHCNFNLRGEESARDEEFVRSLGTELKVQVSVKSFETIVYAREKKLSIQEAARDLRYEWFSEFTESVAEKLKTGYDPKKKLPLQKVFLLTAHHLDDDIETMVFHFFKGTGIQGLRGMPPQRGYIARPMLSIRRQQILDFAKENHLQWVEDSSNAETKYSRNFIRLQLLTEIEKIIPQVKNNLAANLLRFNDTAELYEESIERYRKKLLVKQDSEWMIPVEKLRLSQPVRTILYEILRPFGFGSAQITDALKLMDSETGKWICSAQYRLLRNRKWLVISAISDAEFHPCVINTHDSEIEFAGGKMLIHTTDEPQIPDTDRYTALLDSRDIRYPLILRRWKTGDYFYPLGMKKKKKVSRFFIDLKLSKNVKEKILVLESDKRIIWIPGYRIDERFKLESKTQASIRLEYIPV